MLHGYGSNLAGLQRAAESILFSGECGPPLGGVATLLEGSVRRVPPVARSLMER